MLTYVRCPFMPYGRNSMMMPQPFPAVSPAVQQGLPSTQMPMQQMPAQMPEEMFMQQMPTQMPIQQMPAQMPQQFMQPMQNMQPNMLPIQLPYQNMQAPMMPMAPMQPVQTYPPMPNLSPMEDMNAISPKEEMENADEKQPTTARPQDPPPVLSNNPTENSITLFKELTGYPNYGNPSGNADILYTGTQGTWTFNIPPQLFAQGGETGQILIRAVLDDHGDVAVSRYSARITVNNNVVHNGPVPLQHGVPAGGRFNNWSTLTFRIPNLRRQNNRVTIVNTSTAGPNDWIAFDWMELRVSPRR